MPTAVKQRLRRRRSPEATDREPPLISVVVPFYAVEHYLSDCLTSILTQSHRQLQIILVDDGSPDSSLTIAESYARHDPRVEIIRQPNRGLGAARNTGAAAAHGEYLTFVDSDDTLPPNSLALLVESLQRTGSDFAVGSLNRLVGTSRRIPPWAASLHDRDRLGIRIGDYPGILRNVFAWNKLFRRSFFDRVVRGFPEGVRYEDQEATARAYVGGRFDVLQAVVYDWRKRDDGTSLTQRKTDPTDLADRLLVSERTAAIIAAGADAEIFTHWLAKALGVDLRPYLEQVPSAGEEYWRQLRRGVRALAERVTDEVWLKIAVLDRLSTLAVLDGDRSDLTTLLARREQYGPAFPGRLEPGAECARLDEVYLEGLGFRPAPNRLGFAAQDLGVVAALTDWSWTPDGLLLEGYAFLTNLPTTADTRIGLEAVSTSGARRPVETTVLRREQVDERTRDAWNTHAAGAFRAVVDLGSPGSTKRGLDSAETWTLHVTVSQGPHEGSAPLGHRDQRGRAGTIPVGAADDTGRWAIDVVEAGADVSIRLRHAAHAGLLIRDLQGRGRRISFALDAESSATPVTVSAHTADYPERLIATTEQPVVHLDLPSREDEDTGPDRIWRLRADVAGATRKLVFPGNDTDLAKITPDDAAVQLRMRTDGVLSIVQRAWDVVADTVTLDGDTLVLGGRLTTPENEGPREPAAADAAVVLAAEGMSIDFTAVEVDLRAGTFQARLDLRRTPADGPGGYGVSFRISAGSHPAERRIRVSLALLAALPLELAGGRVLTTVVRQRGAGNLGLRFAPALAPDERGRLRQRELHLAYQNRHPALRDAVLFESFGGRAVDDDPLALCTELQTRRVVTELFWSVDDLRRPVPTGAMAVLRHSRAWLDVLSSARYVVNNDLFPDYFRKRPGQIYVQTWHGSPISRLGADAPGALLSPLVRDTLNREATYWDVLLAQSDYAADVLSRALGFRGTVLTEGSPRTDPLSAGDVRARRSKVRRGLGLGQDQLAVLYAPALRDNAASATGLTAVGHLNSREIRARLGDQATVLYRSRRAVVRHPEAGARDVTDYPQLADLLLAADVLVTDYSSVMIDFCLTGKPILFLVPDLDAVRSGARGLYLDYDLVLPGPICMNTTDLIDHLESLDALTADYAERYKRFRETYAPRDDGSVARRVVEAIWGPAPAREL